MDRFGNADDPNLSGAALKRAKKFRRRLETATGLDIVLGKRKPPRARRPAARLELPEAAPLPLFWIWTDRPTR